MPLPSTGWLPADVITNQEVLPAMLPVDFIGEYYIGTDDFENISDPSPGLLRLGIGDSIAYVSHGVSEDGTEYGLNLQLIRSGAYGTILVDTLVIPEVLLKTITKEVCPPPFSLTKERCPTSAVYDIELTLT